jgi:hypothetical protein
MFAPPRVCFGKPERIKSGAVAGLCHPYCFFNRLHAELQNPNAKRNAHDVFLTPS